MDMGPRTNLYRIGGDPLTQLNLLILNFIIILFFIRNAESDKIIGKYVVGDPLTQFKLIK